jgi:uncharacterized protein (DUF4415 family)
MAKRKKVNPELTDENNPELTAEDFSRLRPAGEVMGADFMRKVRGKQKTPTKELISIRLSKDVLTHFRGIGRGWQSKVDEVLRQAVKRANR